VVVYGSLNSDVVAGLTVKRSPDKEIRKRERTCTD